MLNQTQFWRSVNTLASQNNDFKLARLLNQPGITALIQAGLYDAVLCRLLASVIDLDDDASYNARMCDYWLGNRLAGA